MKKFAAILMVLAITVLGASALGEADLQEIIDANIIYKACDIYPCTVQRIISYDAETGEILDSHDIYTQVDDDMGRVYTSVYPDGSMEFFGGDKAYGYVADSGIIYVYAFIGSAYEDNALRFGEDNLGMFMDGMQITSADALPGGMTQYTIEGEITEDTEGYSKYAGKKMVTRLIVHDENLIIESCDVYLQGEDGENKLFYTSTIEIDPEVPEMPFDLARLDTTEDNERIIHVISDYGTDDEFDTVISVPVDIAVAIELPAGFELYEDPECTIVSLETETDENGNYPAAQTLYMGKKAE